MAKEIRTREREREREKEWGRREAYSVILLLRWLYERVGHLRGPEGRRGGARPRGGPDGRAQRRAGRRATRPYTLPRRRRAHMPHRACNIRGTSATRRRCFSAHAYIYKRGVGWGRDSTPPPPCTPSFSAPGRKRFFSLMRVQERVVTRPLFCRPFFRR